MDKDEEQDEKKEEDGIDGDLSLALWNSLTNMMCWVMFRSILEMHGNKEHSEELVNRIFSEWRAKLMKDVNVKINDLATLRQSLPSQLFSGLIPDEEQTRVKFTKSIKAVESLAKQMLFTNLGMDKDKDGESWKGDQE